MHRHFLVIAATGLQASTVLATPPVAAQPSEAQAQSSTAIGVDGTGKVESADEANQLYVVARERYKTRDLLGSIAALKQCYELTHDANLLFNIGQVYRELDACGSAVDYYRQYVEEAPRGDRAIDAAKYLKTIGANCRAKSPAAPPTDPPSPPTTAAATSTMEVEPSVPPNTPAPAPPPPSSHTAWTTVGWASLGVAAVATVASVVLIPKTIRGYNASVDYLSEVKAGRTTYLDSEIELRNDAYERDRNWLIATGTTAGLTAAFGVVALTVMAPRARREMARPSVSIVNGGAVVGFGWSL